MEKIPQSKTVYYCKSVDAVVGDFTILANRSNYVDFTQPYAESALTMIVPAKSKEKLWLFTKPFNSTVWLAISFVFIYTMLVLWFLERRSNPDFTGPWKNQLSTALWFTFSTLFFAHREDLRNNFARVVMVVWLFVVFVVTASYTASLTSMLTVQRLEPTIDIATLNRSNSSVGCDGDGFVIKYAIDVLGFHPNNIINFANEFDYPDAFKSGKIKAALLELPYERVFISRYGKEYQVTDGAHRFGGLGFAFPKGSPMVKHFSEAFLNMSEDGTLNKLDNFWFKSSNSQASQCKDCDTSTDNQRLGLDNFSGLFLVTVLTSTIMVILNIVRPLRKLRRHSVPQLGTTLHVDTSFWNRIKTLSSYFNTVPVRPSHKDPKSGEARDIAVLVSSNGEFRTDTSEHPQTIPVTEIELSAETFTGKSDTQTKVLRLINSFPGWDRRHGFNNGNPDIPNNTGF
ncbi:hypothetical protein IFM89_002435 [Coptis chinensis]|uniref:Ionotropic glutamate receptor C-terminal domain-containing protein n=1 Tax=Coptis chinensis TaxID=261450 RepID=A0A835IGX4_9MAGN|nr:hypothetical protein IFM89_002435 [Coptis chinensis]